MRLIAFTIIILALIGCSHEETDRRVEYQASISHFVSPIQISETDDLVVQMHGVLGNNGCFSFGRVETIETEHLFELTLYGIHDQSSNISCTQAVVEWDGKEFVKQPPHSDPVRIVVHQPDGTTIENSVSIFSI